MKIKKFLEKVAEEDRESLINDRDIEFLASIGVDYEKKREAAKKEPEASYYLTAKSFNYKALLSAIACFLVVAITAVSLSLYFTLRPSLVEPPIQYFEDNFDYKSSTLEELNENLKLFTLTINTDEYDVNIKRTFDTLSGDNIYFTLEFTAKQNPGKKFDLDIVVNKFYTHEELTYYDAQETQIAGYNLKYYESSRSAPIAPFVNIECIGEMQIGEQWIYITRYEEMALEQSTLIDTLESLIIFN